MGKLIRIVTTSYTLISFLGKENRFMLRKILKWGNSQIT